MLFSDTQTRMNIEFGGFPIPSIKIGIHFHKSSNRRINMFNQIKNRKNSIVPDKFFYNVYKVIKDFTADEDEFNEFTMECQTEIYSYIRDGWKSKKSVQEVADEIYYKVYMG